MSRATRSGKSTAVKAVTDPRVEQFAMLREQANRFGVLHEAQALQLRLWPKVALPHLVDCEAQLDFEKKVLTFVSKQTKGKVPTKMDRRCQQLDQSVKFLLGEQWTVKVKVANKLIYTGAGKKQLSNDRTIVGPTT